jgi:acetyl-CoA C-acetyltransferase
MGASSNTPRRYNMSGIKDRVAIVGMGCTKFGELWDKSFYDLMVEACYEAFEDSGIEPKDIQAAWWGSVESGKTGCYLENALKLDYIPITRVENMCATGADTFRNAAYAVAAGIYDIVLACGVEKLKDHWGGFSENNLGPYNRSLVEWNLAPAGQFAQLTIKYFDKYDIPMDEAKRILAHIAVKNHHNGTLAPKAHFRREVTLEQVINSPILAYPFGLFDCCGVSDGCAAAILTTPEIAKGLRKDYVLVKGLGLANGGGQAKLTNEYDWIHFGEAVAASQQAYGEAGITNPRDQIDMAEVHDCFTGTELLTMEDLGFSPRGKASDDVLAGFFNLDGGLPVNTDGGLKCFGHPLSASGLRMTYEIYKQLQGKAESRQLKKCDLGLTHNIGGHVGMFSCSVAIFGRP